MYWPGDRPMILLSEKKYIAEFYAKAYPIFKYTSHLNGSMFHTQEMRLRNPLLKPVLRIVNV